MMNKSIEQLQELNETAWGRGYHLFPQLISTYSGRIGVEVGVAFGGHSEAILKHTQVDKLYGVDPYCHSEDYKDIMNLPQSKFDLLYERTRERLGKYKDRFELVRARSTEAARTLPDSLDFVYLDADHSYEGCLRDIIAWSPKVKEGGVIGGHDYNSSLHPGVTVAVDKYFGCLGWYVKYEGYGCWWVEKQHVSFVSRIKLSVIQCGWLFSLSLLRTTKRSKMFLSGIKRRCRFRHHIGFGS
jgi:hypothetical protein